MGPIVISTFGQTANMIGVSLIMKLIVRGSEDMWIFFKHIWAYNVVIYMMTKVFKRTPFLILLIYRASYAVQII